jgi:transposase
MLWQLYESKQIDLVFADEAGFQLVPCIPYGWQPIGQRIGILPRKGKTLSIFGLLHADNRLVCYPTEQMTNADFIIQCIDDFVTKIEKPTVIILDNAPIHRAHKMLVKRKEWENKDLFIFFLPRYSPHLNRIETLWRKTKYEWLKPRNYKTWGTLTSSIKNILASFGSDLYNIKFSRPFYMI